MPLCGVIHFLIEIFGQIIHQEIRVSYGGRGVRGDTALAYLRF